MTGFRVWIRHVADDCRVRVDGMQNAKWLLARLGRSSVFKNAKPIDDEAGSSSCIFHLRCSSQMPRPTLERLLAAIPEVELLADTA
jgi:hypothetical protein